MLSTNKYSVDFDNIDALSHFDKAYQSLDQALTPFYNLPPNLDSFKEAIKNKASHKINRELLVDVLIDQYQILGLSADTKAQISSISSEQTFTVTTAHQPVLLTGPLYMIYKIASTINLSKQLKSKYPDHHFVPIFIIGGEDHDFEEMASTNIFKKKFSWTNNEGGSVGRHALTGMEDVVKDVLPLFERSEHLDFISTWLEESLIGVNNYAEHFAKLIHGLFDRFGLVILNMDDRRLKQAFTPIISNEVLGQGTAEIVRQTQKDIESAGFGPQAYVRDINFFYLQKNSRNHILKDGEGYNIKDTGLTFSAIEMQDEINNHPERFSPNVIIRPIYQETILPNLAYIGGGGELAYWMERKAQFGHLDIPFPILVRRSSALWLTPSDSKKLNKLGLTIDSIFNNKEILLKSHVKNNEDTLDLTEDISNIMKGVESLSDKIKADDTSLTGYLAGETRKMEKILEGLAQKSYRSARKRQEVSLSQVDQLMERLFPNGGLQERTENILSLLGQLGPKLCAYFIQHLDPLKKGFVVFEEEKS